MACRVANIRPSALLSAIHIVEYACVHMMPQAINDSVSSITVNTCLNEFLYRRENVMQYSKVPLQWSKLDCSHALTSNEKGCCYEVPFMLPLHECPKCCPFQRRRLDVVPNSLPKCSHQSMLSQSEAMTTLGTATVCHCPSPFWICGGNWKSENMGQLSIHCQPEQ